MLSSLNILRASFAFMLLFALSLPSCTPSANLAASPDRRSDTGCAIRKYGNAPEGAKAFISKWEQKHPDAKQGWTFDPRAVQDAMRRHYAARALFGTGPTGGTALYFLPADGGFTEATLAEGEAVPYTNRVRLKEAGSQTMTGTASITSSTAALEATSIHAVSDAEPYHGFLLHPGIINALAAQPFITAVRVYFCDDPERKGDAAGVLIVGVDTVDVELWGLRSFYQDGSTLSSATVRAAGRG